MVVNGRPLKRMKKRVTANLHDFLTFSVPVKQWSDHLRGPFRCNIKSFLSMHCRHPSPCSLFPHLMIWHILLRIGELVDGDDSSPSVVGLDVIEEDVTRSRSIYCDQCRVVGWSGHPVCGKRYHFIIQRDYNSIDEHLRPCNRCGDLLRVSEYRCRSCNYMTTADDLENWLHLQLEDTTHLLHGVVHMNGYGHLLRVNGREGGSNFLSGCDIMNFWDHLCKTLGVRKVSVMDISRKYGLDYRIIHAVTNGHPWYGGWGYEFGAGSFGLTVDSYKQAVETLSDMPLSHFFQARKPRSRLQDVIIFYQSLAECTLRTIKDLFSFLMKLIHETHKKSSTFGVHKKSGLLHSWAICTWTSEDIQRVEQSIVKVLLAVGGSQWVSWRALKGALCKVASPELIDHCLRELGGKSVGNGMIVLSQCNPHTNAMEYRLESCNAISGDIHSSSVFSSSSRPSEYHLLQDLKFLYDTLLNPQTMLNYRSSATNELAIFAASKLIDCKQFVKEYKLEQVAADGIHFLIYVELADQPADYTSPPPELIVLRPDATIADLKLESAKAFQDVYVLFKRFEVEELTGFSHVGDKDQVKFLVGSNGPVYVRGRCLGATYGLDRFRMERGTESWIVNCACGAKDDDGERMLACDSCGAWQHTRCSGIPDLDVVPEMFVCQNCESAGLKPTRPDDSRASKNESDETGAKLSKKRVHSKSSKICKAQVPESVYQHVKESSSCTETCGKGSVDTVSDTCSSRKRPFFELDTDAKCMNTTTAQKDSSHENYHISDLDFHVECSSDHDTTSSTVTLSDHVEEESTDSALKCKQEAGAVSYTFESGYTILKNAFYHVADTFRSC